MMELRLVWFKMQLLIFLVILLLVACSDSGTDSGIAQVETVYGLGECEAANEGVVKLVTSENQYYKCKGGSWKKDFSSNLSSAKPCKTETEDNCEYGVITDERDGQMYLTVKIDNQVWMAENLNYRYLGPTADADSSSYCLYGDPDVCEEYGRLYLWSAAMDSAGIIKGNTANDCGFGLECTPAGVVRGVCPKGWHVPSYDEWNELFAAVGGILEAVNVLKSRTWNSASYSKYTDAFGFSVLPAGTAYWTAPYWFYSSESTVFWSSMEDGSNDAYGIHFLDCAPGGYDKYHAFSIRCLKD